MANNINLDLFLALKKLDNYGWHPLTKYVSNVLSLYASDLLVDGNKPFNTTFESKLDYVCKRNEKYSYLKNIFKPLDIINYQDNSGDMFYLFRYKNYLELSELGYDVDKFFNLYDGLYLECRSVVFDNYGALILAAMPKFKNYGEDSGEWSTFNCEQTYTLSSKRYITDKMDGSYVQFTFDVFYQKIIGSTSKNLNPTNDDAGWRLKTAYKMLNENYKTMIRTNSDYTFHFEFIHPNNPIVVCYPKEKQGLYLISARNKVTGKEMEFNHLRDLAQYFKVKTVKYYQYEDLTSILSQLKEYSSNEKEGWVVNCVDKNNNSFRFKVKTDDYVLMHKALSRRISSNTIIKAVADGKWDDFYSKIPDAYKEYVNNIFSEIIKYQVLTHSTIEKFYNQMPVFFNRKDTAKWIEENVPKFLRKYIFLAIDKREYSVLKKQKNGYIKLNEIQEELKLLENILN